MRNENDTKHFSHNFIAFTFSRVEKKKVFFWKIYEKTWMYGDNTKKEEIDDPYKEKWNEGKKHKRGIR